MTRHLPKNLAALAVTAVIILVFALVAANHDRNTRRCHNLGGNVVAEWETKRKSDGTTTRYREHECIVNGVEVFEW